MATDVTAPPATRPAAAPAAGGLASVPAFFRAVRAELDKVSWPPREELIQKTRLIVVLSVILGVAIGLLDAALQKVLVDFVASLKR